MQWIQGMSMTLEKLGLSNDAKALIKLIRNFTGDTSIESMRQTGHAVIRAGLAIINQVDKPGAGQSYALRMPCGVGECSRCHTKATTLFLNPRTDSIVCHSCNGQIARFGK